MFPCEFTVLVTPASFQILRFVLVYFIFQFKTKPNQQVPCKDLPLFRLRLVILRICQEPALRLIMGNGQGSELRSKDVRSIGFI